MKQYPIAPDGWPHILIGLVVSVVLYFVLPWLAVISLLLTCFFCFFFRNPTRIGPVAPADLISPADGKVMAITKLDHVDDLGSPAVCITIFLSLFNVHINRAPMSGDVFCRRYRPGKYLPAFKSHASDLNERNTIGITDGSRKILVNQITGFIARRIVCDVTPGDTLNQRQRFGMIRFGSCTELICPVDVIVLAKAGDRVRAGQTVLARFTATEIEPEPEVAHDS
ncbi:MAG: phosphatidylserine decarboxylase family protein [Bacillota bacterium]|nr:phosphatidylserine decarboxylase family protein [Bacillota bacterium]